MFSVWLFLVFTLGVLPMCHPLTCTANTDYTCTPSKYVTGKCVSGVCQCVDGTVPDTYGCHPVIKPTVTISDYADRLTDIQWSGDMRPGTLWVRCNPSDRKHIAITNHKWFLDGREMTKDFDSPSDVIIDKISSHNLLVRLKSGTWKFQCSVDVYSARTEKSDPLVLTVRKPGELFTEKPVMVGMPKSASVNASIKLGCDNIPRFNGSFLFHINGETIKETHPYTFLDLTKHRFNTSVTCSFVDEDTAQRVTSDPVYTPSYPASDIPNVVIKRFDYVIEYGYIKLSCEFTDTFVMSPDDEISYTWTTPEGFQVYKNQNKVLEGWAEEDQEVSFTCTASYKNKKDHVSPVFYVNLNSNKPFLEIWPKKAIIGGYVAIVCKSRPTDSSTFDIHWMSGWKREMESIELYTDNVIQLNNITVNDLNQWFECLPQMSQTSSRKYISAIPMSKLIPPTLKVQSRDPDVYIFSCETDYDTPGMEYEWYVDDVKKTCGRNNTFSYQQSLSFATNVKCRLFFNTDRSDYSRNCSIPGKGTIATPEIAVEGSSQTFYRHVSYRLKCSCEEYFGASYSWKRGDQDLHVAKFHYDLTGGRDGGNYTCTLTMVGQSKVSKPFEVIYKDVEPPVIKVLHGPPVKMVGDVIELQPSSTYYILCSSPLNNNENVKYKWKAPAFGDLGAIEVKWLVLQDTKIGQSSIYTCSVNGYRSKPVTFLVMDVPRVIYGMRENYINHLIQNHQDLSLPDMATFITGGDYVLACDTGHYGDVLVNVGAKWMKDSKPIKMTLFHGLYPLLDNVQEKDSGEYSCEYQKIGHTFRSNILNVSVIIEGKYCGFNVNCTGEGFNHKCVKGQCQCMNGYHVDGQRCVPLQDNTTTHCPDGQHTDGQRCVPLQDNTTTHCPDGQHTDGQRCVPLQDNTTTHCPDGQHTDGQRCVPLQDNTTTHCPDGQHKDGQRCVPDQGSHVYQTGPMLVLIVFVLRYLLDCFMP